MRLFVAAVPPAAVTDHLAQAVRPLRDDTLRWTSIDAWHVTLAFYGEVAEARTDELVERIARAARRHPPAGLRFAGAGRFDAAVVWVGVQGEVNRLTRLAQSMAAAGRRMGIGPEHRRFRPHVTVARSKGRADLRPYVERLTSYDGPPWTIGEATLFRSHPDTGHGRAPLYEVMGTFPLTGIIKPPPPPR